MKKTRFAAVIVAFLIVALLALLLIPGQQTASEPQVKKEENVAVVSAAVEIPAYTIITEKMLCMEEIPSSAVHPADMLVIEEVVGKRSLVDMTVGETIMQNHILDPDDPENRLAFQINEGMRAMTVAVDDTTGVCNLIKAGDWVDLVVVCGDLKEESAEDGSTGGISRSGGYVTLLHLQNIEVLALDEDMLYAPEIDNGYPYYRSVTLSVSAEDELRLAWAEGEGRIYLALRGEDDHEIIPASPYRLGDALADQGERR